MSAHFVINHNWNGLVSGQVEFFPFPERDRKKGDAQLSTVLQRYELTDAEACLPIEELIVLCAAGRLKKWEPKPLIKSENIKAIEQHIEEVKKV